jgi:hypothetical protein
MANPHANGTTHVFTPAGLDVWDARPHQPKPGQKVRIVQPRSVPRNGTMGHVYVEDAETGNFHGLVLKSSLLPST